MTTRLYKVSMGGHIHLVEAKNQAQAISHVTKGKVKAEILSALDAAKFVSEGHKVEVAGAQEETKEEEGDRP